MLQWQIPECEGDLSCHFVLSLRRMTNKSLFLKPNWLTAGLIATCSYVSTWCTVSQHVWIFLYTFSGYVSICEEGPVQTT